MSVLHQLIVENLRDLAENPSCSIQASKPNSDARVMLPIQSLFVSYTLPASATNATRFLALKK